MLPMLATVSTRSGPSGLGRARGHDADVSSRDRGRSRTGPAGGSKRRSVGLGGSFQGVLSQGTARGSAPAESLDAFACTTRPISPTTPWKTWRPTSINSNFPSVNSLIAFLAQVAEQKVIDEYRRQHTLKRDVTRDRPIFGNGADGRSAQLSSDDPTRQSTGSGE